MPTSESELRFEAGEMRSKRLIENSSRRREDKLLSVTKINSGAQEIVTISSSSSDTDANTTSVNPQTNGMEGKAPKVETKKKKGEKGKEDESAANQKKRKNKGEEGMVPHKKKKLKKETGEGESVALKKKKKKKKGQDESKVTLKKKRKNEEEEEGVALQKTKVKGQEESKGSPKKKTKKEEENRERLANQKKKGHGEGEGESSKGNLKKKKKKGEGEGEKREGSATQKENRKKAVEEVTPVHLEINDKKNEKKKKQKKENKGNEAQKVVNLTSIEKGEETKKKGEAHCGYNFPMSRIERIVRSELDDARISQEALFLINKASEKFLQQFVDDAYASSVKDRKNYVAYKHLASAVSRIKRFDFLSDFVPERVSAEKALAERSAKT